MSITGYRNIDIAQYRGEYDLCADVVFVFHGTGIVFEVGNF